MSLTKRGPSSIRVEMDARSARGNLELKLKKKFESKIARLEDSIKTLLTKIEELESKLAN